MIQETYYQINTPVSIALITDTHNQPAEAVIRSLQRHKTDLICIAGDYVYARLPDRGLKMTNSPYAVKLLKKCSRLAPTFVSIGNHEWMLNGEDLDIIKSTGATLVDNHYFRCQRGNGKNSKKFVIGGLSSASYMAYKAYRSAFPDEAKDPRAVYPLLKSRSGVIRGWEPETDWLDQFCQETGYKILLSHHPEYYPVYLKKRNIDLILSGHAHGRQIRIKGQGLYAPGQGFLPKLTSGIVDKRLIISRGLTNNTIIPRLGNPGEIVYIS